MRLKKLISHNLAILLTALILLGVAWLFFKLRSVEAQGIFGSIEYVFRKESLTNDSYSLAKAVLDLERIGLIKCIKLKDGMLSSRVFLDNTQVADCNSLLGFFLDTHQRQLVKSNSGNQYEIEYRIPTTHTSVYLQIIVILLILIIGVISHRQRRIQFFNRQQEKALFEFKLQNLDNQISIARKVAHDIRSPISTLNLIASHITNLDVKELQIKVVKQINEIAINLLEMNRANSNISNSISETTDIISLADTVNLVGKEFKLKSRHLEREIQFSLNSFAETIYISPLVSLVIYRSLNNFVQNAIEATSKTGKIAVSLNVIDKQKWFIDVTDDGIGIDTKLLEQIGENIITENISAVKKNFGSGSGIALFYAKKDLAEIGLKLTIKSIKNKGTSVTIST